MNKFYVFYHNYSIFQFRAETVQLASDNKISIIWQFPQIAVLTAGECLFAITGNEFAYSQAAPSMRALVQAVWLMTSAAGNLIVVLIELADIFHGKRIVVILDNCQK